MRTHVGESTSEAPTSLSVVVALTPHGSLSTRRVSPHGSSSDGSPLPSTGCRLGSPLAAFSGTMRLSDSYRLIPPGSLGSPGQYLWSRPPIRSRRRGRSAGARGRFGIGRPSLTETNRGGRQVSQVPVRPLWTFAVFLDPGGSAVSGLDCWRRAARPPLTPMRGQPSTNRISGLDSTAYVLAVYASPDGSPHQDARLASGCWPSSTGWDCLLPTGSLEKFPRVTSLPPFTSLPGARSAAVPRRLRIFGGAVSDRSPHPPR